MHDTRQMETVRDARRSGSTAYPGHFGTITTNEKVRLRPGTSGNFGESGDVAIHSAIRS